MRDRGLVSVVVPTRNSAATLEACLTSIRRQTYGNIELLVVDRGSTDDTPRIAQALDARLLHAEPERSAQRNAGAREAQGRWVLFVDSDMVLEEDVIARAVDAGERTAAVVIPEHGFDDRFFTRVRALEKRCYVGNDAVEAARFFDRERFVEIGGYDETMSAGEDWDLTDRWRAAGGSVQRIDAAILHDDRSLTFPVLLRKRFRYGIMFVPFLRARGSDGMAHLRPGRFLPRAGLLARSPVTAGALLGLKSLEAVFFGLGIFVGLLRSSRVTARGDG